jgi:hypothetical protein
MPIAMLQQLLLHSRPEVERDAKHDVRLRR